MRDVITIDGPAGAGKTTTARAVAEALGFVYLDSGALYRGIAVAARARGLAPEEGPAWEGLFAAGGLTARPEGPLFRVWAGGAEVTADLRSPEIAGLASRIATLPAVRERVRGVLRALAAEHDCVAEGRDMGSAVFPDARLKIFLDASPDERARRRHLEFAAAGGEQPLEDVARDLAARDERDVSRPLSPLRPPPDAVRICNTRLSQAQQAALVVALFRGGGWHAGSRYQRFVKAVAGACLRALFPIEVEGLARVPRGPFLLASNHRAYLDPPLLGTTAPGPLGFLAKRELFRVPGFAQMLRGLYAIPLRRGAYDKLALEGALSLLSRGISVAVFPEGTRVRDPARSHPRRGVAVLARLAQVPVLPAFLSGTDRAGHAFLRRGRIRVRFGTPLAPPDAAGGAGDEAFLRSVMAAIAALGREGAPSRDA